MIEIDINPKLINDAYFPYLRAQQRTQIFFGGSSSGKSFFLAGRLVTDLLEERNYLVCRNVGATLRQSVFQEVVKAIGGMGLSGFFSVNKSDMTITCANGYQAIFRGLDDVEKIKSTTPAKGVLTDVWVEEATECKLEDIKQLFKRLRGKTDKKKRVTFSFNPVLKSSWLYKEYFEGLFGDLDNVFISDELLIVKTTYKNNAHLSPDDIKELEDETDPYFHSVYSLGNWGVLGDLIFKNWEVTDLSKMISTFDRIRNGLDFGFSSDPAAFVRSHYDIKTKAIYIFQEAGGKGYTNADLKTILKPIVGSEYIACDSAEPKSIEELNRLGINAVAVSKGKDSILHGIQWLQQHKIIVDKKCQNVTNELSQYQWQKDKHGDSLPRPIDKFNHYMDALRYSYETEAFGAYAGCDLG